MKRTDPIEALRAKGIQPSSQRVAIAGYVLATEDHPSADDVWKKVRKELPVVSRATVYNTLNLFVKKGLLRELVLAGGAVVFDPHIAPHHHFIDEETGEILDIPWDKLKVPDVASLRGLDVRDYQVVLRGTRRR